MYQLILANTAGYQIDFFLIQRKPLLNLRDNFRLNKSIKWNCYKNSSRTNDFKLNFCLDRKKIKKDYSEIIGF